MANSFRYYVEGDCEKHFIDTFKSGKNPQLKAGKVEVFNILNEKLTNVRLISFTKGTTLIIVYDTDVAATEVFKNNLKLLEANDNISKIYHVQSVKNFEEEIVYSTNVNKINDVFETEGINEFKHKFVNSNVESKLKSINFKMELIWSRKSQSNVFSTYKQSGNYIKLK